MLNRRFMYFMICSIVLGSFFSVKCLELYAEEQAAPSPSPSLNSHLGIDRAWEVLAGYHLDASNIDKTIELLEENLEKDPDNIEALLLLSRAWITYGYVKARTRDDLIRVFENGMQAAEKAVELDPDNPDAHFFYVASLASLGDTKGIFNSLFMLPEVRRELDLILELDPNNGNALAMQGALFYYLPGILGGDLQISEIYIRRSLSIDPHQSSAKLYLAMNLRKQKRYQEALEELIELVNDKEPTFYPDWYINRQYAVRMISSINRDHKDKLQKQRTNRDSRK
jgi:tetratricopeptide (TPR) repeat protein